MAQFRKLFAENGQRLTLRWTFVWRIVATAGLLFVLWKALGRDGKNLSDVWQSVGFHVTRGEGVWLLVLLVLVPVNWALESRKWQLLVGKVQRITFSESVGSTLAGLLSGLALPAQIGDVVGRVAALKVASRSSAIGAALISGGIQFYAAVFTGIWGAFELWEVLPATGPAKKMVAAALVIIVLAGVLAFAFRKYLVLKLPGNGIWGRVKSSLAVIALYDNAELLTAFAIGLLRYLTYAGQFVAGLLLFGFPMSVPEMAACVSLVLMVKTVLPALNLLGDLGLRGVSAVLIFGIFGIAPDDVLAVTFLIWATNILFPAVFGWFWVWKQA